VNVPECNATGLELAILNK